MAVGQPYRGQGGSIADEMMADTLDMVTANALARGFERVEVFGYVHESNRSSQAMNHRAGLRWVGVGGLGVQLWRADLILGRQDVIVLDLKDD